MGNTFGSNVWVIDTAAALWDYTTKGSVPIRKLIWKPSDASQTLIIKETDGAVIWSTTSLAETPAGDQTIEFFDEGKWFDGLTVDTITSGGVLYVYLA